MDLVAETLSAIEGRAPDWAALGVRTEVARQSPESLYARFEGASSMADLVVWATGEADLICATHGHGEATTDHYTITTPLGLRTMLDDLDRHVRA
jgi:hypothetical protein